MQKAGMCKLKLSLDVCLHRFVQAVSILSPNFSPSSSSSSYLRLPLPPPFHPIHPCRHCPSCFFSAWQGPWDFIHPFLSTPDSWKLSFLLPGWGFPGLVDMMLDAGHWYRLASRQQFDTSTSLINYPFDLLYSKHVTAILHHIHVLTSALPSQTCLHLDASTRSAMSSTSNLSTFMVSQQSQSSSSFTLVIHTLHSPSSCFDFWSSILDLFTLRHAHEVCHGFGLVQFSRYVITLIHPPHVLISDVLSQTCLHLDTSTLAITFTNVLTSYYLYGNRHPHSSFSCFDFLFSFLSRRTYTSTRPQGLHSLQSSTIFMVSRHPYWASSCFGFWSSVSDVSIPWHELRVRPVPILHFHTSLIIYLHSKSTQASTLVIFRLVTFHLILHVFIPWSSRAICFPRCLLTLSWTGFARLLPSSLCVRTNFTS